jgi:hypothetical protein
LECGLEGGEGEDFRHFFGGKVDAEFSFEGENDFDVGGGVPLGEVIGSAGGLEVGGGDAEDVSDDLAEAGDHILIYRHVSIPQWVNMRLSVWQAETPAHCSLITT